MSITSSDRIDTYGTAIDSINNLSQNAQALVDSGTFSHSDSILPISRLVVLRPGEVDQINLPKETLVPKSSRSLQVDRMCSWKLGGDQDRDHCV